MALHSSPVGQTSIRDDEEGVVTVWKNSHHINPENMYRKVTSSNTSHLDAQAGFFRLLMKGIFDPYVL